MAKKRGTHMAHRSAVTGRFVSKTYAQRHKRTTIKQRIKNPK